MLGSFSERCFIRAFIVYIPRRPVPLPNSKALLVYLGITVSKLLSIHSLKQVAAPHTTKGTPAASY